MWEIYFSKNTEYKKENLEKDLEELNLLRNEIAHNRHITRESLGKIQNLSKKIITTLNLELDDLPNKILTPEEQKLQINIETNRAVEQNPVQNYSFIEKVILEWYELHYALKHIQIQLINKMQAVGLERIKKPSYPDTIGVEIVEYSGPLRLLAQSYISSDDRQLFLINKFIEFHFVIVINDYSAGVEIKIPFKIVNSNLTKLSPKVRVIWGFINENSQFIQIAESKTGEL